MKKYLFLLVLAFVFSACSKTVVVKSKGGNVPPGQMKKMTGSQSAKPYAPGQQKKTTTVKTTTTTTTTTTKKKKN